jgi:hypothetical protein
MHQAGALILLIMLFLLLSGRITEAQMPPLAPLAEGLVWLGTLGFVINVWRNTGAQAA